MRIVVDEDIPKELTPLFRGPGLVVDHVEDIGLKGKKNGVLLAALSGSYDVLVTGDANLGHQQNLRKFDLAIMLIHPQRLVVEQIKPLIPLAVAAFPTAGKHAVTVIGVPTAPRRKRREPSLRHVASNADLDLPETAQPGEDVVRSAGDRAKEEGDERGGVPCEAK